MDPLIAQALRAGRAPVGRRTVGPRVLLAGGGGALGAAVLEGLLAGRAFVDVQVLVRQGLNTALPGLTARAWEAGQPMALPGVDTAVIVFDRERHVNGREQAFWRPEPQGLTALATVLRSGGVRHLLIVQPHHDALLPQALKLGLANLDEHSVSAMGFDHLVFMRPAQASRAQRPSHPGDRLARWMLSQLQLMVPQRDQPVRASKVAAFAAHLAAGLAASAPGTRVVPADVVWEAAQARDAGPLAHDWLHGVARAPTPVNVGRL